MCLREHSRLEYPVPKASSMQRSLLSLDARVTQQSHDDKPREQGWVNKQEGVAEQQCIWICSRIKVTQVSGQANGIGTSTHHGMQVLSSRLDNRTSLKLKCFVPLYTFDISNFKIR